jgi:hypothetical protein
LADNTQHTPDLTPDASHAVLSAVHAPGVPGEDREDREDRAWNVALRLDASYDPWQHFRVMKAANGSPRGFIVGLPYTGHNGIKNI